jgi:glycosyltransferase involved in cell wall biosynthesis
MSEPGREFVEFKYTWPRVAEQMEAVYEWMLGFGPKPECVSVVR